MPQLATQARYACGVRRHGCTGCARGRAVPQELRRESSDCADKRLYDTSHQVFHAEKPANLRVR